MSAMDEYREAMAEYGVPLEPLMVYTSCSWRRVGLAREYQEVMLPTIASDGHPDIAGQNVLLALVAAFNAMIEKTAAEPQPAEGER